MAEPNYTPLEQESLEVFDKLVADPNTSQDIVRSFLSEYGKNGYNLLYGMALAEDEERTRGIPHERLLVAKAIVYNAFTGHNLTPQEVGNLERVLQRTPIRGQDR